MSAAASGPTAFRDGPTCGNTIQDRYRTIVSERTRFELNRRYSARDRLTDAFVLVVLAHVETGYALP